MYSPKLSFMKESMKNEIIPRNSAAGWVIRGEILDDAGWWIVRGQAA